MLSRKAQESGVVLVVVLVVLLSFSVMVVGLYSMVTDERQLARSNRDNLVAFYGAEGGLEQMSAGLAQLFENTASPSITQINSLSTPTYTPDSVTYRTYTIGCPNAPCASPLPSTSGIIGGSGPLAGLAGIITPFTLTVSAVGPNNTEVKLVRQVQEVAVPVFEFGIFSETDLSFFAGPDFNFGGRVHTNGNLFLAEGNGKTLTLADKVTAFKEIIRTQLANGASITTSPAHDGTVNVIVTAGGCPGTTSTCRSLAATEGSVTGGPGSSANPNWHTLSLSTYNANIRNGATGAKQLKLAIALAGAQPIDLIRRSLATDSAETAQERLMNKASMRILLSDTAAALPGNGTFDANGYPAVIPLNATLNASLSPLLFPGRGGTGAAAGIYGYVVDACHPPMALSPGPVGLPPDIHQDNDFKTPAGTPLLGGFIEIDIQLATNPGTWMPVTMEILQQGIERPYTNTAPYTLGGTPETGTCVTGGHTFYPIIHLEKINTWVLPLTGRVPGSLDAWDYIPLNMYDTREGSKRDTDDGNIYLNGVMNYVELDVANLQRWFACNGIYTNIGSCSGTLALGPGPSARNEISGYIVYFSDRRGNYKAGTDNPAANPPLVKNETGEYGNEDIINRASSTGAPDGVLEPVNYNNVSPEDVNGNGVLDTYGVTPDPLIVSPGGSCIYTLGCTITPFTTVSAGVAAKNGVVFFRRALRLYHGALGQLPPYEVANCHYTSTASDGYGGFTVAAENPVYVVGDYNADSSLGGTSIFDNAIGRCHVPAAVMADAVSLLSRSWGDTKAFNHPTDFSGGSSGRTATTTSYRMAIMSGKNISFAQPTGYGTPNDFGTDGGVHNFLRYLEHWGIPTSQTFNYRGSLVSFYYARQATGVYKCCNIVYGAPTRVETFDTDFQNIQTLPPGTPRFTDVNALSFEQALLPYQ